VLTDLGTLPRDVFSSASAINDRGQIAAQSCDLNFNCRATIWQDGVMTDLNNLIPSGSGLYLLFSNSINSRGQIVGAELDQTTGAVVPFLATPCVGCADVAHGTAASRQGSRVVLPESVREQLRQRLRLGPFGKGLITTH